MALFREWGIQRAIADDMVATESVSEAANDRLHRIEAAMLAQPSTCIADFAAKLIADSSDGVFEVGEQIMAEARLWVG